jgi:light-regulated signal transduction histidine kinase (bacteriophytochrome)
VSHDLRAPLRHIDGFADMLRDDASAVLGERSRRYLETISASAKRMGTLIDDLLVFSRMGRAELRQTRFPMDRLVKEVLKEMAAELQQRQIDWEIDPLPQVWGDRAMLKQVWVNLLSNAIKYTRSRERAKIQIRYARTSERELQFLVRDNGVGFDMQYAGKLFGVFQRLHHAEEFDGTGIGLANVRRIVHRHGGRTWAESKVNEGATFYFTLPDPPKQ